jgi:hypothetical protein
MQHVAENELQRVLARRQLELYLGLAETEMPDRVRGWQGHIERRELVDVDEQVVMPRVRQIDTCRRDTHAAQAEPHGHRRGDGGAVSRRLEVDLSALRRGLSRHFDSLLGCEQSGGTE